MIKLDIFICKKKEIATKQVQPDDLWKNFLTILADEVLATNYGENVRGLKFVN